MLKSMLNQHNGCSFLTGLSGIVIWYGLDAMTNKGCKELLELFEMIWKRCLKVIGNPRAVLALNLVPLTGRHAFLSKSSARIEELADKACLGIMMCSRVVYEPIAFVCVTSLKTHNMV